MNYDNTGYKQQPVGYLQYLFREVNELYAYYLLCAKKKTSGKSRVWVLANCPKVQNTLFVLYFAFWQEILVFSFFTISRHVFGLKKNHVFFRAYIILPNCEVQIQISINFSTTFVRNPHCKIRLIEISHLSPKCVCFQRNIARNPDPQCVSY